MSRRPSVSIYDYPEDLNPFKDDVIPSSSGATSQMNGETKHFQKEPKHKFWTFGRSKKKQRSNSFSIKSWGGLFGKRKDSQEVEIRKPTIATVSSTYKRETYNGYPIAPARSSKDQQEFDEALGTLARRRKYTLDNSSRYSSSLTVNGDPGRIYEGSPQNTTTSIMGDLTPKPPARRFGQMSPKPTDKIPPLNFNDKENTSNEDTEGNRPDEIPIPPKRGGQRASQRSLVSATLNEENPSRSIDVSLTDENENVPEDYVFKRFSHDAIRKSNLSINSCVSVGSTVSAYGRKKRRAPQPPRLKESLEAPKEITVQETNDRNVELEIVDPMDITRVTENIDEMTKRSREMDDDCVSTSVTRKQDDLENEENKEKNPSSEISGISMPKEETSPPNSREDNDEKTKDLPSEKSLLDNSQKITGEKEEDDKDEVSSTKSLEEPQVELRRDSQVEKIEIIKEVEILTDKEEHPLKRRKSSGNLSRSDSFSVKEEIEKIERQIKILESRQQRECSDEQINEIYRRNDARMSLQETRKNFFRNMVDDEHRVKVELKELPREQKDIKIVRLEDSPVAIEGPKEPVKIIQLHISEPIKRKPSIIGDREVNPIPKPRRNSNLGLESKETRIRDKDDDDDEKRGNSL